jgi:hypothetical protein
MSMLWASVTTNVACFRRTAGDCPKDVPAQEIPAPVAAEPGFCFCCAEPAPQKACGGSSPCSQRERAPQPVGEDDGCPIGSGPCCLMMVVTAPEGLKWEAPPVVPEFVEASPLVGDLPIVAPLIRVDVIPPRSIHPMIATTVLLI